jgi:hypothetical protein
MAVSLQLGQDSGVADTGIMHNNDSCLYIQKLHDLILRYAMP